MSDHRRDMSARQSWRNFRRSELPLHRKLGVTVRNNFLKLARGKPCCGHHGQPGC